MLQQLTYLNLSITDLAALPEPISNFRHLKHLSLIDDAFYSGVWMLKVTRPFPPSTRGGLQGVTRGIRSVSISLSRELSASEGCAALGELGRVEELEICASHEQTCLPEGVRYLVLIRGLKVTNRRRLESLPRWLSSFPSLISLHISGCPSLKNTSRRLDEEIVRYSDIQVRVERSSEFLHSTLVLRVSIHCEGCKKKVKKVLQSVEGVFKCDFDARSHKVTVAVTGKVSADLLIKKLRRSGKHAEQWPEEQKQRYQPTDTRSHEAKNQTTEPDNPGEPTDKPAPGDAETNAAERSNPKTYTEEPKKTAGVTAKPDQESTASTNVGVNGNADADGDVNHGGTKEATAVQSIEPKRKRKQGQEETPAGAKAAAVPCQTSYVSHLPLPLQQQQQPVHVMSYNVARPSASAAYYAAAPEAMPAARPPQEYSHLPYYYSQPSPTGYYYHYGHGTPQSSAASPARDSYGDLFSDDNANSCSVM